MMEAKEARPQDHSPAPDSTFLKALELFASRACVALADCEPWTATNIEHRVIGLSAGIGLRLQESCAIIRLAMTGSSVGLPLFESMELLGRDKALRRLADYVKALQEAKAK